MLTFGGRTGPKLSDSAVLTDQQRDSSSLQASHSTVYV